MSAVHTTPEIRTVEGESIMGEKLPCGCWLATRERGDERAFLIEPCSLGCPFYRYSVDESRRQGKPVKAQREDHRPRTQS